MRREKEVSKVRHVVSKGELADAQAKLEKAGEVAGAPDRGAPWSFGS